MATDLGLRERKKQRTRTALKQAATRLFDEKGYDQTTIADIAAAAEISPRTFFSYFAGKEDVLFVDTDERIRIAVDQLADPRPHDRPVDLLLRAIERMMASPAFDTDMGGPAAPTRLTLVSETPSLQAASLRRLLRLQLEMTEALHRAYPQELDAITAAAIVGALTGSVFSAALAGLRRGDDLNRLREEINRAVEVAVQGIAASPPR